MSVRLLSRLKNQQLGAWLNVQLDGQPLCHQDCSIDSFLLACVVLSKVTAYFFFLSRCLGSQFKWNRWGWFHGGSFRLYFHDI